MSEIYVPIDEHGFADRVNMSIVEPESGAWAPFDASMNGLYKPKWDGEKWVEGATPQEIEDMTPPESTRPPSIEERLEAAEQALIALVEAMSDV